MTTANPVQLSMCNLDEIVYDGNASCYHCTATEIGYDEIERTIPDHNGLTAVCPWCDVDALVAWRHLPCNEHDCVKQLTEWRWGAWEHTREEDLNDYPTFQNLINHYVQGADRGQQEWDFHDLENFLEETDYCQDGIPDWALEMLVEQQDDDRYNQWQNRQDEMTDGIQQDGDEFFNEIQRHHYLAELPQRYEFGEPYYAAYHLPDSAFHGEDVWVQSGSGPASYGLSKTEQRELIGQIIGQNGCHLKAITEQMGAYYIWYYEGEEDVYQAKAARFEVWAPEPLLPAILTTLEKWCQNRIDNYHRSYWRRRFLTLRHLTPAALETLLDMHEEDWAGEFHRQEYQWYHDTITEFYQKFCPAKVCDVDYLLERYQGKWVELLHAINNKYAPDGCRVFQCSDCQVHFCPNYPPSPDSTSYSDDQSLRCDDCCDREMFPDDSSDDAAPVYPELDGLDDDWEMAEPDEGDELDCEMDKGDSGDEGYPYTPEQCDGLCAHFSPDYRCEGCR